MATPAQIKAWLNDPSAGSDVYRRNWNGKCQALMWQICARFGVAPQVHNSAISAANATRIVSKVAADAPVGAFHYWKLGTFGHVALGLGGDKVLMASTHVDEVWATAVGVVRIPTYNARVAGETYIGWGYTNGANDVAIEIPSPAPAGDDIKEIIIMTAKEVWEYEVTSVTTGDKNQAADFLVAASHNAGVAATAANTAVDKVAALSNGYESAHPDPAKAAKGEKHTDSLQSRVGAIHIRTWLIPGLVTKVDQILGKLNALTAPQVTVDAEVLEAAFGRALDARLDTIAAKVAEKITYPTEGTITLRAVENTASK